MAQGQVTIDIRAQVSGYEASLRQLQQAFAKIDPGSEIGKKLGAALKIAEKQLQGLEKNLTPRASSSTQIDAIVERSNKAGEAIQHVARMMQQIGRDDLNFDFLKDEISSIVGQIGTLQSQLDASLNTGFKAALSGAGQQAEQLRSVFDSLGVSLDNITMDNGMDTLTEGLEAAKKEAEEAGRAIEEIQKKINSKTAENERKYKNNPLASENFNESAFITGITNIKNPKQVINKNQLQAVQQQMLDGLFNLKLNKDQQDAAFNLVDSFFAGLTPDNIRQKLNTLTSTLNQELNITKQNLRAQLMNGQTDNQFINSLLGIDPNQLDSAKFALRHYLEEIAGGLKSDQVAKINGLIDKGKIDEAKNATMNALRQAYAELKQEMQKNAQEFSELNAQKGAAEATKVAAEQRQSEISTSMGHYEQLVASLQTRVQSQESEIASLKAQLSQLLENQKTSISDAGKEAGGRASELSLSADDAARYNAQLEQVQKNEQMIGKIQGVAQQWFSIYAAIRMVSNAIRSIISTIQELDATITEIAIVTDMDQSELWGQMSAYTDMARTYASSISGVYQVSQLYYQQGGLNI